MVDVLEERKRQEERTKKIMKEVDKTGREFQEELKNVAAAEEHIQEAERRVVGTDKKIGSTEKNLMKAEKDIKETHELIKDMRTSPPEKRMRKR